MSSRDGAPQTVRSLGSAPAGLAAVAVAAGAFVWSWIAGRRGFSPFGQSIVVDGGWRVFLDQVPFRDFTTAHGVVAFWIQAGCFALLGPTFDAVVFHAALANAAASLLAYRVARLVRPGTFFLPLLAAFGTAVWFYPPSGTPSSEQTAFLFDLASLLLVLEAVRLRGFPRTAVLVGAGVALVAAFFAKQNAGALFAPVLLVVLMTSARGPVRRVPSDLAGLGTGVLLGTIAFLTWLSAASDPAEFLEAYFVTPSGRLWPRLAVDFPESLFWPLIGRGPGAARIPFLAALAVSLALLPGRIRSREENPARVLEAALVVALVVFQNSFNATSNHDPELGYSFGGLILALGLGAAAPLTARRAAAAVAAVLLVLALGRGLETAWNRKIHPLETMRFDEGLEAPGWEDLRWPLPLRIQDAEVFEADVERLIRLLEERNVPFFVFPDFTFLYAVTETVPPQPVLWFHEGLTYPSRYDEALDRRVVRSIERGGVGLVVLEDVSYYGTQERLADFPRLRELLDSGFCEVARIGIFRILDRCAGRRRAEAAPARSGPGDEAPAPAPPHAAPAPRVSG